MTKTKTKKVIRTYNYDPCDFNTLDVVRLTLDDDGNETECEVLEPVQHTWQVVAANPATNDRRRNATFSATFVFVLLKVSVF